MSMYCFRLAHEDRLSAFVKNGNGFLSFNNSAKQEIILTIAMRPGVGFLTLSSLVNTSTSVSITA